MQTKYTFEQTTLWQKTLAAQTSPDSRQTARERLRTTYLSFRERVALMAAEIHTYLPEYTVHDITHLDALWEMADIIVGKDYPITPTEAFVLGGAILLHDLGMGLASYPRGIEELKKDESWADIVTAYYLSKLNRRPTANEVSSPPKDIERGAGATLLRNLHAKHAEQLALIYWTARENDPPQFLIEDNEIRLALGRVIGLIAHSHWWPVSKVEGEFSRQLGAPHRCPIDWVVDPLKIACILRVADASHIDARRAPSFLRALRKPSSFSDEHWKFQEKLQKPHLSDDALAFTSGFAFPLEDATAWWICLDTLGMIDRELRQVDALLADKGIARFAARRVAGIESPERLVSFIPTDNWLPINAQIQVSDVPRLIKTLGAEELYGRNPTVALRELIQNASDAIRARRYLENRDEEYGEINIRLGEDDNGIWLEVEDNGIGMSSEVLTNHLLDFGTSYWGSSLMTEEFPGLLSSGVRLTGKYGIGFFSIFMLGEAVRVRTRRADAAQSETLVLEFNTGLSTRPIIRPAAKDEYIRDGGACVRIWLKRGLDTFIGQLGESETKRSSTLQTLCSLVAPSLDVKVRIGLGSSKSLVVSNSDWINIDGRKLLTRLSPLNKHWNTPDVKLDRRLIARASKNLRLIKNPDGEIVGRACITVPHLGLGALTVGGLFASELIGIGGILTGTPERAARDVARPLVTKEILITWATEQADLISQLHTDIRCQMRCAQMIRQLGGHIKDLPIAFWKGKPVSYNDISNAEELPDELIFVSPYYLEDFEELEGFTALPNVINVRYDGYQGMIAGGNWWSTWPEDLFGSWGYGEHSIESTLGGVVIDALAEAWGVTANEILLVSKYKPYEDNKVVFGHINNERVKGRGFIVRRPN